MKNSLEKFKKTLCGVAAMPPSLYFSSPDPPGPLSRRRLGKGTRPWRLRRPGGPGDENGDDAPNKGFQSPSHGS